MQIIYHILRFLFAALLFMTAAGNLGFMPPPEESMFTPEAWALLQALQNSGYMMPIVGGVSGLAGIAMILNRYIALASIVIVPISVNILLFHVFLDAAPVSVEATPAYVFFLLNLFMLYASRSRLDGIFLK